MSKETETKVVEMTTEEAPKTIEQLKAKIASLFEQQLEFPLAVVSGYAQAENPVIGPAGAG